MTIPDSGEGEEVVCTECCIGSGEGEITCAVEGWHKNGPDIEKVIEGMGSVVRIAPWGTTLEVAFGAGGETFLMEKDNLLVLTLENCPNKLKKKGI